MASKIILGQIRLDFIRFNPAPTRAQIYTCGSRLFSFALIWALVPSLALSAVNWPNSEGRPFQHESSPFRPTEFSDRDRSVAIAPLLSFLIPGLDQWVEHQYEAAAAYTGTSVLGLGIAASHFDPNAKSIEKSVVTRNDRDRSYMFGLQMVQGAGSLSAYHAFRTAVTTRPEEFEFLTREESPQDLLAAPLRFQYLTRWTTFVPIGVVLAGTLYDVHERRSSSSRPLAGNDVGFATGFSYIAGVNEEALFRGWLLPYLNHSWNNPFWANTAQAAIFGAAHLGSTPVPIAQALMGFYFGHLVQQNEWTLGEVIFIHAWWDVIAFLGEYSLTGHMGTLYLPLLAASF